MRRACRTVAGFAPVAAVTAPALADAVVFAAQWRSVRPPAAADLAPPPGDAVSRAATSARMATGAVIGGQATVPDIVGEPAVTIPSQVRAALDPTATVAAMVAGSVTGLPAGAAPAKVAAAPRFTNPMYRRLRALSPDYLVPGLGDVPPDTLGLLVAEPEFVESFLAGLNHELLREFRWREYPASPRDTWSRRFWDAGTDDIQAISAWRGALGTHHPPGSPETDLVLLIRGALPRRYPDLRVYCAEAMWEDGRRREDPTGTVYPVLFQAQLAPDCVAYGFALGVDAARGSTDVHRHPGYFIVLEQHPGAPRFGLDQARAAARGQAPRSWTDLSWGSLVDVDEPQPDFVDVTGPPWLASAAGIRGNGGIDMWGADAAAMGRITFQRPVRMLTHASAMLPPAGGPPVHQPPVVVPPVVVPPVVVPPVDLPGGRR
jgi:hypothetical protein